MFVPTRTVRLPKREEKLTPETRLAQELKRNANNTWKRYTARFTLSGTPFELMTHSLELHGELGELSDEGLATICRTALSLEENRDTVYLKVDVEIPGLRSFVLMKLYRTQSATLSYWLTPA